MKFCLQRSFQSRTGVSPVGARREAKETLALERALDRRDAYPTVDPLSSRGMGRGGFPLSSILSPPLRRGERKVEAKDSRAREGVALVITLIMLSIITVITVAFLAVTQRERASVSQTAHMADTELATGAAYERLKAEILFWVQVQAFADTNAYPPGPGLLVSTNFDGWDITNNAIPPADWLTNLQYDPRVPVLANTNIGSQTGPLDPRYYLDLNRNGLFEDSGLIVEPVPGGFITNFVWGDPQWVGVLADPNRPHSGDNHFVSRYAYIVLPAGIGLDLNFIHNDAKRLNANPGFRRNQGVGSWEVNLAAFLADVNTNLWGDPVLGYAYNPDMTFFSRGFAFQDAHELLQFRYNGTYNSLRPAAQLFAAAGLVQFRNDVVDEYSDGPLGLFDDGDNANLAWPGSDGPQHFFSIHDLWGNPRSPNYPNFVSRLHAASTNANTSSRYTFYRIVEQLTTDAAPDDADKINLNYVNVAGFSPTNLISWTERQSSFVQQAGAEGPTLFFHEAADRMLRREFVPRGLTNISVLNIPIYTNSSSQWILTNAQGQVFTGPLYSPRIQQILQIAANLHDATTDTKMGEIEPYYPSVFRPLFERRANGDVYIVGYREEDGPDFYNSLRNGEIMWLDPDNPADPPWPGSFGDDVMFYGIPMIVGARRGLPNFNEFTVQNVLEFTRKLEFRKRLLADPLPYATNQMLLPALWTSFGAEAWNSYTNFATPPYPRPLQMWMGNVMSVSLTNRFGASANSRLATNHTRVIPASTWGWTNEFQLTPMMTALTLTNAAYYLTDSGGGFNPHFEPARTNNSRFESDPRINLNQGWGLAMTNRLLFFLFDNGRIIDAVSLAPRSYLDVSNALDRALYGGPGAGPSIVGAPATGGRMSFSSLWDEAPYGNVNRGVREQILLSLDTTVPDTDWLSFGGADAITGALKEKAVRAFQRYMSWPLLTQTNDLGPLTLDIQAPFSPSIRMTYTDTYQANDPLVHYTLDDLRDSRNQTAGAFRLLRYRDPLIFTNEPNINVHTLGRINRRFKPWGQGLTFGAGFNYGTKDPGVWSSESWDFPTNKFANIGWLGRVHRGTPWQTLYLKAGSVEPLTWSNHVGAAFMFETMPTNDWRLADLFTTAPHPNATRGALSVNQTNLAAWSAVLSGIPVTTLADMGGGTIDVVTNIVQPAALEAPVAQIVEGINRYRTNMPGARFRHVGDVLGTPELTDLSPFLNAPYIPPAADDVAVKQNLLTDADYERVPQQILSLLKLGDARFVVYAWGQSLQPAPGSIVTSGPFHKMPVNYQVTGEMATRAVVRVEFARRAQDPRDPLYDEFDYTQPRLVIESFNILPVD